MIDQELETRIYDYLKKDLMISHEVRMQGPTPEVVSKHEELVIGLIVDIELTHIPKGGE